MAKKVSFTKWMKAAKANQPKPATVEISTGEDVIQIEVKPTIPYIDQMTMYNRIVELCCPLPEDFAATDNMTIADVDAKRDVHPEYLEYAYRVNVLGYYTNLDLSSDKITTEDVWTLAGDNEFFHRITCEIQDELFDVYGCARDELERRADPTKKLADRINRFLDKFAAPEMTKILEALSELGDEGERLGFERQDVLRLVTDGDQE